MRYMKQYYTLSGYTSKSVICMYNFNIQVILLYLQVDLRYKTIQKQSTFGYSVLLTGIHIAKVSIWDLLYNLISIIFGIYMYI